MDDRLSQINGTNAARFAGMTLPYSNFGEEYFRIRAPEYVALPGYFPMVFFSEGKHALDISCGIEFMSVLLGNHYCAVTGIDVEGPTVAFNVEQPNSLVGNYPLVKAGISSVEL